MTFLATTRVHLRQKLALAVKPLGFCWCQWWVAATFVNAFTIYNALQCNYNALQCITMQLQCIYNLQCIPMQFTMLVLVVAAATAPIVKVLPALIGRHSCVRPREIVCGCNKQMKSWPWASIRAWAWAWASIRQICISFFVTVRSDRTWKDTSTSHDS